MAAIWERSGSCGVRHTLGLQPPRQRRKHTVSRARQTRSRHPSPPSFLPPELSTSHLPSGQDQSFFTHSANLASPQEKLRNGSSSNKWNSGTGSVLTRELLCLWQLLWFGFKICFCIRAPRFTQPTKKHWKCLWLFTLETFLTVYQQRPPDGYPIMHGLHSSKKFLEFGLLRDHHPLKCTL